MQIQPDSAENAVKELEEKFVFALFICLIYLVSYRGM